MMRRLSHDEADQLVVEQRLTAGHQARDAGLDQPGLDVLPDAVIAVQHRVVAPVEPRGRPVAQEVGQQPVGLGSTRPRRRVRRRSAPTRGRPRAASRTAPGLRVTRRRAASKICREQRRFRSRMIGVSISKSVRKRSRIAGSAPVQEKMDCSSSPTAKQLRCAPR